MSHPRKLRGFFLCKSAQRELDELNAAFKIEIKDAHFFLGNNINVMTQDGAP